MPYYVVLLLFGDMNMSFERFLNKVKPKIPNEVWLLSTTCVLIQRTKNWFQKFCDVGAKKHNEIKL